MLTKIVDTVRKVKDIFPKSAPKQITLGELLHSLERAEIKIRVGRGLSHIEELRKLYNGLLEITRRTYSDEQWQSLPLESVLPYDIYRAYSKLKPYLRNLL